MPEFQLSRDRDAYFVIRGYRYQVDSTILRWLELEDGEHLELECGEDIDIVSTTLSNPSLETARELQQVKRLEKSITLRSDGAKAVLANAVEHFKHNPQSRLTMRFCTNALATCERPSPFPQKTPAINVWESIRQNRFPEKDTIRLVQGIRGILKNATKPSNFNDGTWTLFKRFIIQSDDNTLRELIGRVEWSTGEPDVEPLQSAVRMGLVEQGLSPHRQHAAELHARLFLHLMGVLSQVDKKVIQKADLIQLAKMPRLEEHGHAVLNFVTTEVFRFGARLDEMEATIGSHELALTSVQLELQKLGEGGHSIAHLVNRLPEVSLSPPPLVGQVCERQDTVNSLIEGASRRTWTAIHGSVGTGKTQLSLLAARQIGTPVMHVSLRDLSDTESVMRILLAISRHLGVDRLLLTEDEVNRAIKTLSNGSQIILDDLPRIDGESELSRLILSLIRVCSSKEMVLLTTSHYALPNRMQEQIATGIAEAVPAPRFMDSEAKELFRIYGASESFCESGFVETINVFASGNAALLAAYARSLTQNNWEFEASELATLGSAEVTQYLIDNTVHRLLKTVSDSDTREILYRLCFVAGQFGHQQVKLVADVLPMVSRPRERLSQLNGLWIEEKAERHFVVSPLVKPLGSSELADPVKQRINLALAESIASRSSLTVYDAIDAAHYFSQSGKPNRLGLFLFGVLNSSKSLPKRELAFLHSMTGSESQLPEAMNTGLRILIRSQQVVIADRLGKSVDVLLAELEGLILANRKREHPAVFMAALSTSLIAGKRNLRTGLLFCKIAMELHAVVMDIVGQVTAGDGDYAESPTPADYPWFSAACVRTADDLETWIDFLSELSNETLSAVFSVNFAEMGTIAITDMPWITECEKPSEARNWTKVLTSLERVKKFGEDRDVEQIWVSALRATIVIRAEYLNELDEAVYIAETALKRKLAGPRTQLLINDIIGRQFVFKSQPHNAVSWLESAIIPETDFYPDVRMRTLLFLAAAIGDDEPERAACLCSESVSIARAHPSEVSELDLAAASAELGLAEWLLSDDIAKAFILLNDAIHILLECKIKSNVWKQRVVALGHALGYFFRLATLGAPPQETTDGGEYMVPHRLSFISTHDKYSDWFDEQDYENTTLTKLPAVMATFAESVGDRNEALNWAMTGLDAAREKGEPNSISLLGIQVLPSLLREGRIREGIDVALEFCSATVASRLLAEGKDPAAQFGTPVNEVLGPMPNENWELAEVWAMDYGVIPAVMQVGRVAIGSREDAKPLAKELVRVCDEIAEYASNGALWSEAARMSELVFLKEATGEELHRMAEEALANGKPTLHMLGYLGCTLIGNGKIERASLYHALIFHNLYSTMSQTNPAYGEIALPFLTHFWQTSFRDQRFRFSSPNVVQSALNGANEQPARSRAQIVLNAVMSGLRIRIPDDLQAAKEWLRSC